MFGKIIGIALVALTQFLLWIVLSVAIISIGGAVIGFDKLGNMGNATEMVSTMGGVDAGQLEAATAQLTDESELGTIFNTLRGLPFGRIIGLFIVYFVFGYLLYASLFAAIGAAVENEADTQQLQLPVTIPLLLGFFIAFYAFRAPESTIVWWGSMIPFTSPIVMLARLPFGVPMWELILSIGLLVLTFFACAWASAKIYKVGILMYGKKSTFKDLWKWLKQK